jgi:uncharacterized circularly permuted ATP-grasp superfamily protein
VTRGSLAPTTTYDPAAGVFDEAFSADATPRPAYVDLLAALAGMDLAALAAALDEHVAAREVNFRADGAEPEPFRLDPVPRLFEGEEWAGLARGLRQRVRALDSFVADVYGERAIVEAGVVPARALDSCDHLEPRLGELPAPPVRIAIAGLDIVRDTKGEFRVLEDNVRTPSGIAYLLAAREALERRFSDQLAEQAVPLDDIVAMLRRALIAAAPEGVDEPSMVVLSDGPANSAFYEHRRLARELGLPGVVLGDLSVRSGRLHARCDGSERPVDVVYRRTDEDRLTDERGRLTTVGAALYEPLHTGRLAVVNGFGTGVADDKLIHAYAEDMVRFYLDEDPLLRSVRTYDLGDHEMLEMALDRIDELVIKPRSGHGGRGVIVAPHARAQDIRDTADEIRADPGSFVAQELVMLSRHPTVVDGRLEPRHVDLRPFVFLTPEDTEVAPGGLTRVALERDALVVNSSQRGGAKDTWVLR